MAAAGRPGRCWAYALVTMQGLKLTGWSWRRYVQRLGVQEWLKYEEAARAAWAAGTHQSKLVI